MSNLKARLARLEASLIDVPAQLLEMIRLDAPLLEGSPEHLLAMADPGRFNLANRPIYCPDEPGPENPIL